LRSGGSKGRASVRSGRLAKTGRTGISVLMRSGGHEAELAPARGCEGSRFGACSGRLTWRQKTGGSLPVDAADGSDFEAFALRRRVRRRRKGALLPDDAAKDRGRGACFSCDVRQRMDRGSLRFEAANGSRGGVRFPSKVRRVEGSGFASMPGSRRGCGWDCKVRLRFRRALAKRRIGLARTGGRRRRSFPGSFGFPSGRQAAKDRAFASGSNRPKAKTDGFGLRPSLGMGRTRASALVHIRPFEAERRREPARGFGNGERA